MPSHQSLHGCFCQACCGQPSPHRQPCSAVPELQRRPSTSSPLNSTTCSAGMPASGSCALPPGPCHCTLSWPGHGTTLHAPILQVHGSTSLFWQTAFSSSGHHRPLTANHLSAGSSLSLHLPQHRSWSTSARRTSHQHGPMLACKAPAPPGARWRSDGLSGPSKRVQDKVVQDPKLIEASEVRIVFPNGGHEIKSPTEAFKDASRYVLLIPPKQSPLLQYCSPNSCVSMQSHSASGSSQWPSAVRFHELWSGHRSALLAKPCICYRMAMHSSSAIGMPDHHAASA